MVVACEGLFYGEAMYRASQLDATWVARAKVDYALNQIAYASCPTWEGASATAAEDARGRLAAAAMDLFHLLHEVGACLQEALELQAQAAQTLALQAAA